MQEITTLTEIAEKYKNDPDANKQRVAAVLFTLTGAYQMSSLDPSHLQSLFSASYQVAEASLKDLMERKGRSTTPPA